MRDDSHGFGGAQGHICERPRLKALLDAAFEKPFVVVAAGPGFGKTTAVSQYLADTDYSTVWLSCAAPDNAPARFWEHLTRVFAQHRPGLGKRMEAMGFPGTERLLELFLAALSEELYRDEQAVAFVFDDVHLLSDAAVLGFLANLVAARLENSCMVLLSRVWPLFEATPPVPPQMIGTEDLRFTREETVDCLARMGLHPDAEEAERIHQYVSGWPIALSLIGMGLRRGEPGAVESTSLATTKPALYALFEREIFSQYTPAEQDLLIKLSVLDSYPRGLVQAVSGEPVRDLQQLLRGNIFIGYNADTMRMFFHPLYHEFLREKLRGMRREDLASTYVRAAEWCRDNGYYYDAANYYRQSGQYGALWDTLMRTPAVRHTKREAEFFIEQIEQLPEDFAEAHPMTRIVLAMMLVNNQRFDEAAQALDRAQAALAQEPQNDDPQRLLGEYHVARGLLAVGSGRGGFAGHFKQAAQLLPQGSSRWSSRVLLVDLGPGLSLQSEKAGTLKKSLAEFAEGVPYMVQVMHGGGKGLDRLCQSEALFLTGKFKKAAEPAYQAFYPAQTADQYDILGNALFMLLRIHMATGDYAQVREVLEQVEWYAAQEASGSLGIWDIVRGWFYVEMGEVGQVAGWIRSPLQWGYAPLSMDRALLLRLRGLIAAGQYAEALALAGQFEEVARSREAIISLLYVALARAVSQDHLGNAQGAAEALRDVYRLAGGNRLFMPLIEYGSAARLLVEHVRQTGGHGLPGDWLDDMYAKAATYAKRHAHIAGLYRQEQEGRRTDYALSRREAELLANLSQGLTREELSQVMQLSPNTIKSMTKMMFAKLGAINAADAVRIAIVHGLI